MQKIRKVQNRRTLSRFTEFDVQLYKDIFFMVLVTELLKLNNHFTDATSKLYVAFNRRVFLNF